MGTAGFTFAVDVAGVVRLRMGSFDDEACDRSNSSSSKREYCLRIGAAGAGAACGMDTAAGARDGVFLFSTTFNGLDGTSFGGSGLESSTTIGSCAGTLDDAAAVDRVERRGGMIFAGMTVFEDQGPNKRVW